MADTLSYLRLPNNGARYSRKRKRDIDDYHPFSSYVAWHDDTGGTNQYKPPNGIYCKINPMNHLERSIVLRREMEKSERRASNTKNAAKTKMRNRRIVRKRRRPPQSLSNDSNGTKMDIIQSKRIRRQMNCNRNKTSRNERLKALLSGSPNPTPKRHSAMDLWDQISMAPKHIPTPSDDMTETFDSILNDI